MSYIMAAGTAITAFGQYESGQAAKSQGQMQGKMLEYQGTVERANALQQAALIRRAQGYAIGRADTAAAASGVVVGQGSAGEVDRQIYTDSERDAYQAILGGERRASGLHVSAVGAESAGDVAAANADAQAAGTVLQGGYQMLRGSGWRSVGAGWSGTQAPAPVIDRSTYGPGTSGSSQYPKG